MLTKLLVAPLFIAASAVAHPRVQHHRRADADVPLSSWSSGNLESYWRYKNRFNSLGCSTQTGTDFYTNCCYPLGASESLSDRPAECTPTSLSCGAPVVSAATVTPAPAPAPETNTNTPTDSSSNDNYSSDNYDESSLPYCEAGQSEYDDDDSYTDASYNNGGSSSDTYTPPASDNSQAQPTDGGNTGNTGNTGGDTSGNWNAGGYATYYYQNGNAGACGVYHADTDMIGAIDVAWYGDMGQQSQYCGRSVRIKNLNNGRTVDIIVADVCPTCATDNSFDLSEGAFKVLDDTSVGTFPIEWTFI